MCQFTSDILSLLDLIQNLSPKWLNFGSSQSGFHLDEPPNVSSSFFVYIVRSSSSQKSEQCYQNKNSQTFLFFCLNSSKGIKLKASHRDWPHPLLVPCFLIVLLYDPVLLEVLTSHMFFLCTLCSLSYTPESFTQMWSSHWSLPWHLIIMNANDGPTQWGRKQGLSQEQHTTWEYNWLTLIKLWRQFSKSREHNAPLFSNGSL